MEVLKQNRSAPVPVEKQVAILYATIHDYLVNAVFEISLAHKSHILHACHEKANYMRVGHVALNSAESDSSDTISYSQKPNADIH